MTPDVGRKVPVGQWTLGPSLESSYPEDSPLSWEVWILVPVVPLPYRHERTESYRSIKIRRGVRGWTPLLSLPRTDSPTDGPLGRPTKSTAEIISVRSVGTQDGVGTHQG